MHDVTLHDFARDIASVIEAQRSGPGVIVGHAYDNWVARMTVVDFPRVVRGIVLAAAVAKKCPPELSDYVSKSADMSLSDFGLADDLLKLPCRWSCSLT